MKKIIFIVCMMFSFILPVSASKYGNCSSQEIKRMYSIVNNVNITYSYTDKPDRPYFNITLTNMTNDIFFYDLVTERKYYYSDTNNGEITISGYSNVSGNFKFYSNNSKCKDISLGVRYYNLPEYNFYYNSDICKGLQDFYGCQKWGNVNLTYSELEKAIEEYKNPPIEKIEELKEEDYKSIVDYIIEFYLKYYIFIYIALIIIVGLIVFFVKKNNRFKL